MENTLESKSSLKEKDKREMYARRSHVERRLKHSRGIEKLSNYITVVARPCGGKAEDMGET